MKNKKFIDKIAVIVIFLLVSAIAYGLPGDDKNGKKTNQPLSKVTEVNATGKNGDAYRMYINNINLPMNRKGVIADVNIAHPDPNIAGAGGKFANKVFLFSSGFFLSGYKDGNVWANAVASASLVEDYIHGTVANGQDDPNAVLYVLRSDDTPFTGQGWVDWKDAVALGADFYDGDNDGVYNPVDKNANGKWDPDEDAPDMLGDETVWCVYSDGILAPQRRWLVDPIGIEVRQTVFGFSSAGPLGNIIFVRYRFKYVGLTAADPDKLTDVYFGVWADPDLGFATDDLVACDTTRDAGYVYNKTPDQVYGNQPPAFMFDFFSGPIAYFAGETYTDVNGNGKYDEGVDTPLDTAYSYRGQMKGIKTFPGGKNLKLSSFVMYMNGDPDMSDPSTKFEARNYMLGLQKKGTPVDVCAFGYGQVRGGVNCALVNNRFWFSGDPVKDIGWINSTPTDQRLMQNIGPFELERNIEKEVTVAYVVGQGSSPLDGITVAKTFSDGAQFIFDQNFAAPTPPPSIVATVLTGEDFIDILFDTKAQFGYQNTTTAYDLRFKGYKIHSYKTATTEAVVNNLQNKYEIAHYQKDDFLWNIFKENATYGYNEMLYPRADSLNRLDSAAFSNETTGKFRLRLRKNPIDGSDLVKGKPYYFSAISYGVNYRALKKIDGSTNDYTLSSKEFVAEVENIPKIFTVTMGEDLYNPPQDTTSIPQVAGYSKGKMLYDIVDKTQLTGDKYKITFFKDKSITSSYSAFWKLINETKGTTLIDSSKKYYTIDDIFTSPNVGTSVTDGFILKILNVTPTVGKLNLATSTPIFDSKKMKLHYVSLDAAGGSTIDTIGGTLQSLRGNYVTADRMRRVELRFGANGTGKAYRYIQGVIGTNITRRNSVRYAENITPAEIRKMPAPLPVVGNWMVTGTDTVANGFVDVPFTAWVKDFLTNEEYQLAVGFIEKAAGNPDGNWDPDTSVIAVSGEYILIFDQPYDATGSQNMYKGGKYILPTYTQNNFADLRGKGQYTLPAGHNLTADEVKIVESPFFNSLYVVGLPKKAGAGAFVVNDKVEVTVGAYPYSSTDEYVFTTSAGGVLSPEAEKNLFEKVNVYPNPLYGFNTLTAYSGADPDQPFVTFTNLPEEVTIKIYTLAGTLVRTLGQADKSAPTSPYVRWNLENESGLRVASGLYLAIVSSPKYGDKVLKFSIILPQKQLPKY